MKDYSELKSYSAEKRNNWRDLARPASTEELTEEEAEDVKNRSD